jgi:GNAT superfamily N-acetyltransferase
MTITIKPVETDSDIDKCFAVMSQLRPHLTQQQYVEQVKTQMQDGYRLACAVAADSVVAVAGYRISHSLAWGRFMYVDDLVTDEARRSKGFGKALLNWLVDEARHSGCGELHLDSGLQRKDAHRFYEREGMEITGYHFNISL